jgi:hypothetical protein
MNRRRNFTWLAAVFNTFVQIQPLNLSQFQTTVNPPLKPEITDTESFFAGVSKTSAGCCCVGVVRVRGLSNQRYQLATVVCAPFKVRGLSNQRLKMQNGCTISTGNFIPYRSQPNNRSQRFNLFLRLNKHPADQKFSRRRRGVERSHFALAFAGGGVV